MAEAAWSRSIAGALAAAMAAAGCGPTVNVPSFQLAQEEWAFHDVEGKRLVTDHFDIRTTLKDEQMVDVLPTFLETCRARCVQMVRPKAESAERLAVYVFNTRAEWEAFTVQFAPDRARLYRNIQSGGFTDQPTATSVLYSIGRDRTLAVAAHESWHQYAARHLPAPMPAWMNEGLATQMEAFDLYGGAPVFTPRKNYFRRNHLRAALTAKDKGLLDLPELLRMHAGDVFGTPGRSTEIYYAQIWSVVLFLMEGPNRTYTRGFRSLLDEAGSDAMRVAVNAYSVATPGTAGMSTGELVFRKYITDDLAQFAAEYVAFARDLVRGTPPPGAFPW